MRTNGFRVLISGSLLISGMLFISGCKSNGTIDVVAMQPIPLSYMSETGEEALAKLKEVKISSEAVSQLEATQYILSQDLSGKITAKQDEMTSSTTNPMNGSVINETFAKKEFTAPGGLLGGAKPVLNSRYAISNLADLYEWRMASEMLFKLQEIFGDKYTLYCVPAIVSVSPGSRTYRNFFARVTFNVESVIIEKEKVRTVKLIQANDFADDIHLLALTPFRQFDNRSESLSRRTQLMLTLMASALAKAGTANINMDAYYSMLKRLEKDFTQINRVPAVTSFIRKNRYEFGWDIYPSPAISGEDIANMMTADTWRLGAIIAVKNESSIINVTVKPSAQWIRIPDDYSLFDNPEPYNIDPINLKITKPVPMLAYAIPEKDRLVKLSGMELDTIKSVKLTRADSPEKPTDVAGEIKVRISPASDTLAWVVLEDGKLEDKKSYLLEVIFSNGKMRSSLIEYNVPQSAAKATHTPAAPEPNKIDLNLKGSIIGTATPSK